MFASLATRLVRSRTTLLRALRLTLWVVPVLMAVAGMAFTLFENARHWGEPGWPLPTVLGLLVLGLIGPVLSWVSLYWAIRTAEAYLTSEAQLAERNAELAALNALGLAASSSLDMEKTLAAALEQTMSTLDASAAMLFLQEDKHQGLRLEAHRGISVEMATKEARLAPGYCLCGQAVKTRQVLLAHDAGEDRRCTSNLCICEGFRSVACAPLEVKGQLVGLLQLASPNVGHFTESQKDFLAAIARQVGVSIENARLYDEVRLFNVELEKKVNQRTRELESARWALAEKARQLQRLLSESYRVQEDTQARIAHDMHDGVTQIIIGALYETQAARQSLIDDPERAAENLERAQGLLTEVETEIRRVIYDMHPPVLDQMGLAVALKRFAATYQTSFGIECQIQIAGKAQRLYKETEVTIYRIIQAALHNVATHARAKHARVHFDFGTAALQVNVEDDGIGFDPEAVMRLPGEHLGLIGMKERAEGLKADLMVDSAPGKGSRIMLCVPAPVYLEQ
ncbi:MAG TPA: GAF domain-containing sensor histidine kinase [Anaerolineales bacterium]|nr:GAF domain-containing sensor histidine kinase [Anaerolineales bacterium]